MGVAFSAVALFVLDFLQPGWRDLLCNAVSIDPACDCNVGPSTALFSVGAEVTSICPLGFDQIGFPCATLSNFNYCFDECENRLQGTVSVTDLESLDFSATFTCDIEKVDFNFVDVLETETDRVSVEFEGTASTSGGLQLTECGPIELFLFDMEVGSCTCTVGGCGEGFDVSIECDPIKEWNGFSGCLDLSAVLF